ncbi:MAG: hypothetical protein P1R58_01390 [bacterium]|nr:hypothetical protein [bacterium]
MIKYLPYLFYMILIGFHTVIFADFTSVWGVKINLIALLIAALALYKSEIEVAWAALALGLVSAAGQPALLGWHALILVLLSQIIHRSAKRLNLDSIWSQVGVIAAAVMIHNILLSMFEGFSGIFERIAVHALPGVVYTSLIAWLFFLIKDKKITLQKIREMF